MFAAMQPAALRADRSSDIAALAKIVAHAGIESDAIPEVK
jgi:hypothetical protein